jgi:hypothetical protein
MQVETGHSKNGSMQGCEPGFPKQMVPGKASHLDYISLIMLEVSRSIFEMNHEKHHRVVGCKVEGTSPAGKHEMHNPSGEGLCQAMADELHHKVFNLPGLIETASQAVSFTTSRYLFATTILFCCGLLQRALIDDEVLKIEQPLNQVV